MEIKAIQKYVRMSPRKLRLVADVARKMNPQDAVEALPHLGKRATEPFIKVIKSAIANAKVKGMNVQNLTFKEIQINEGPTLKRGRPVSRGRWHKILKRMSHIRIVLEDNQERDTKKPKSKKDAKDAKLKTKGSKTRKQEKGK